MTNPPPPSKKKKKAAYYNDFSKEVPIMPPSKHPKREKSSEELERYSLAELVSQLIKSGKSFSIDYKRVGDTCKADLNIGENEIYPAPPAPPVPPECIKMSDGNL